MLKSEFLIPYWNDFIVWSQVLEGSEQPLHNCIKINVAKMSRIFANDLQSLVFCDGDDVLVGLQYDWSLWSSQLIKVEWADMNKQKQQLQISI